MNKNTHCRLRENICKPRIWQRTRPWNKEFSRALSLEGRGSYRGRRRLRRQRIKVMSWPMPQAQEPKSVPPDLRSELPIFSGRSAITEAASRPFAPSPSLHCPRPRRGAATHLRRRLWRESTRSWMTSPSTVFIRSRWRWCVPFASYNNGAKWQSLSGWSIFLDNSFPNRLPLQTT